MKNRYVHDRMFYLLWSAAGQSKWNGAIEMAERIALNYWHSAILTSNVWIQDPLVQSQIRRTSWSPALTKCRLSDENAIACTHPPCPSRTSTHRPFTGFHSLTVLSHDPDALIHGQKSIKLIAETINFEIKKNLPKNQWATNVWTLKSLPFICLHFSFPPLELRIIYVCQTDWRHLANKMLVLSYGTNIKLAWTR